MPKCTERREPGSSHVISEKARRRCGSSPYLEADEGYGVGWNIVDLDGVPLINHGGATKVPRLLRPCRSFSRLPCSPTVTRAPRDRRGRDVGASALPGSRRSGPGSRRSASAPSPAIRAYDTTITSDRDLSPYRDTSPATTRFCRHRLADRWGLHRPNGAPHLSDHHFPGRRSSAGDDLVVRPPRYLGGLLAERTGDAPAGGPTVTG